IAQPLGMIPMIIREFTPDGRRRRATEHPLYTLLHDAPNPELTAMEFREAMTAHAVMRGSGYAKITPDYARSLPVGRLDMLHPDQVTPETLPSGVTRYKVRDERTGQDTNVLYDEMFKVRGMTLDGVNGVSVLTYARETIGRGLAQQEYSSRFYRNGASPRGFIESSVTDVDARRRMIAQFDEKNAGVSNAHRTPMLPPGYSFKPSGLSMEDAQFVESEMLGIDDIARFFGIPPHIIYELMRSTNNNIEEQAIEYVVFSLSAWGIRWEQSISRDLMLPSERDRFRAHLVWDALLRGKTIERYQAHEIALRTFKQINEVRENEDLDAVEGGDVIMVPLNMVPLSQVGQRSELVKQMASMFALDAASAVLRMEIGKVSKAAAEHADDGLAWAGFLDDFYVEHSRTLEKRLHMGPAAAAAVCERHKRAILTMRPNREPNAKPPLEALMESWEISETPALAALAVADGAPPPPQLPAPSMPRKTTKHVERDDHGRIVSVTEVASA
ncbi:MAG: phage portal protein, partial [Gemmatimonadales bacterium]|nr:phage portal protein [Gemmatimonadales bacterium]